MRPLALITGASSGIGAVFARQIAARGFDLLLVARRGELLEKLAKELEARYGIQTEILVADLTSEADLAGVEKRVAEADALELVVNNAGFGTMGKFFKADLRGQDQMHRLHVLATLRLTHAALTGMVARDRGGIINVSSVAGFWQAPGSISYCATKTWINSFTEGLYLELKSSGSAVQVQALCPGYTYSEFHDTLGFDRGHIPKWLWMRAEDVVAASLRGLDEGKLFVVPGWQYKIAVALLRAIPRSIGQRIAVRQARALKRD
jgi:short-subunit dehydrogenase